MISKRTGKLRRSPFVVLACSLLLTGLAVWGVRQHTKERVALEFEIEVTRIQGEILDRLDSYLGVVWAAVGLFEANDLNVTDAQLRKFRLAAESGSRNDGLVNLTFVRKVEAENFEEFEANNASFNVHPYPAGLSGPVYVITHVQPHTPEHAVSLGFAPFSEPIRRRALQTAAETGEAAVTEALLLKSDQHQGVDSASIILYAPVYHPGSETLPRNERQDLLFGFLGASFHLSDLVAYVRPISTNPSIGFRIYSGARTDRDKLLIETPESSHDSLYSATRTFLVSNHPWTVEYWSLPDFHARAPHLQESVVAIFGLLLSLALFVLSVFVSRNREAQEELLQQERQRAQDLEEQTRAKTRFFSSLNHELRTPLNGILGMSDLLYDTELTEQQRDYLNAVGSCAQALLDLVNDALDLSKIEAGKMVLRTQPVKVENVFRQAFQVIRGPALSKGLGLEFTCAPDLPMWAELDGPRLRQVLVNLLGNAVKFTSEGSVVLKVEKEELEGHDFLSFQVKDTGIGISDEDREKLFRPFSQVGDSSTLPDSVKGTGLGLHICKELLEMMGGQIWLESTPNVGTSFFCRVPLKSLEGNPYETKRMRAIQPGQLSPDMKILVVDDNPINRRVLALQLSKLGYEVETASDGHEGVTLVREGDFDLVLMDCQMPGMDGLEATRQIRQSAPDKPIIVALTAAADEEQREACMSAGMNDFLAKPLDPSRLERDMQKWEEMLA